MDQTRCTPNAVSGQTSDQGELDEFLHFFTSGPQPYSDVFDTLDAWQQQYRKAVELGIAPASLSAPLFIVWEITGRCPQNCIYCYNESPKKVEDLSPKRLFQVADQIIAAKVFSVCLSGGEPTMRPEYLDLLQYLAVSGVGVGTVLSGWRIDKEKARRIGRYVSSVQLSLDGSTPELHDAQRRRKGSYDDVVHAIKLFCEQGTKVSVAMALTRYNIDDFPNMYRLCNELGVESLRIQKLAVSGRAKKDRDLCASDPAYERLKQFIRIIDKQKTEINYGDPTQHIRFGEQFGACLLARITAEGYVGITPYLDIYFGDLKREDLAQIWPRMRTGWRHPRVMELLKTQVEYQNELIVDWMTEREWVA